MLHRSNFLPFFNALVRGDALNSGLRNFASIKKLEIIETSFYDGLALYRHPEIERVDLDDRSTGNSVGLDRPTRFCGILSTQLDSGQPVIDFVDSS